MLLFLAPEIQIQASELECTYARSSGPGGQNVNKVNSKCIVRWHPAESRGLSEEVRARFLARYAGRINQDGSILLTSDRFRDQKRNYEDCIQKLKEMLLAVARPPKKRKKTKPSRSSEMKRRTIKKAHSDKKASRRSKSWD
jgi:ribosome-associated protein